MINGDLHGLRRTWHFLPRLLAGVAPSDVFLTNAYIGCPDVAKDNAPFPKTREHSRRCRDLLELELFDPRLVVCFGKPAARMLAEVVGGLDVWKGTWSFDGLEDSNVRTVTNCTHAQSTFTAVVVKHPAAAVKTESRLLDIQRITDAARAPI